MDEMDGVEATRAIIQEWRKQNCSCNKLLDDEKLYPVIEAGATSYLLKHQEQVILLMLYELLMMEKQY